MFIIYSAVVEVKNFEVNLYFNTIKIFKLKEACVVRKPININPGLKVYQGFNCSRIKNVLFSSVVLKLVICTRCMRHVWLLSLRIVLEDGGGGGGGAAWCCFR